MVRLLTLLLPTRWSRFAERRGVAVSDFLDMHPGGSKIILSNAGKDVTKIFKPIHPPTAIQDNQERVRIVGRVEPLAAGVGETDEEHARRDARENLPHVDTVVNLKDFEKACRAILSPKAAACESLRSAVSRLQSSSFPTTQTTHPARMMSKVGLRTRCPPLCHTALTTLRFRLAIRTNEESWSRILLKPRVLRKVKDVSCETTILGHASASPIYISPVSFVYVRGSPLSC